MIEALSKIKSLTDIDMRNKTIFALLASATEELGELARELKIEEKVFGNTYKEQGRDNSKMEAIDLAICALAIYFAREGTIQDCQRDILNKLQKWERNQE